MIHTRCYEEASVVTIAVYYWDKVVGIRCNPLTLPQPSYSTMNSYSHVFYDSFPPSRGCWTRLPRLCTGDLNPRCCATCQSLLTKRHILLIIQSHARDLSGRRTFREPEVSISPQAKRVEEIDQFPTRIPTTDFSRLCFCKCSSFSRLGSYGFRSVSG